jgi:CO/xanthine dehydrogenase Mo-binding subunit
MVTTAQTIANAVSNAIGYPLKEMPLTPERILQALRDKQKEQQKTS